MFWVRGCRGQAVGGTRFQVGMTGADQRRSHCDVGICTLQPGE